MIGEDGHGVESVLVADFGHASSRAFLIEKIAGAFRFVGHAESSTTFDMPHHDLSVGWLRALRQLGHETGRCLVAHERLRMPRQPRGDGVDALMVCSSLGEPVRVAIIDTGVLATSATVRRALRRTHARVLHETAPSGRKEPEWVPAHTEALRAFQPETVVLLLDGDTANAVPRAVERIRRAGVSVVPDNAVTYGPPRALTQTKDLFDSRTKLRSVNPGDVQAEDFATELESATARLWAQRLAREDVNGIVDDALSPPITRSFAVNLATRTLANETRRNVVSIAVDDDGCHVHWASGEHDALVTLPRLDLSTGITSLTSADVTDASRWLPFGTTTWELLTWMLNRSVRPWARSLEPRDARIEQALMRPIIRRLGHTLGVSEQRSISAAEYIVLSGRPGRWNDPGAAVLALLDGLDHVPATGMLQLAIELDGLLAVAGCMSMDHPDIAADVLRYDALAPLGTALVLSGSLKRGEVACHIDIHREGDAAETVTVSGGDLRVLPLSPGQTATLAVKPARGVAIGAQSAGKPVIYGDERPATGGEIGLIVDARGRPLPAASSGTDHSAAQCWLEALGSDPR